MQSSFAERSQNCRATATGCSRKARQQALFWLAVSLVFLFASRAQSVFAAFDVYIYKDANGALTFTSVPTQARYIRVIRSEDKRHTRTGSSSGDLKNLVVQLFRDKNTDEVGYLDGETFVPLWPEGYTTFTDKNTEFASPDEYEDIWVSGLSDQVGLIKMRRGLPLGVIVTAVDWLIEQNLDKYQPPAPSHSYRIGTMLFAIIFVIGLASLLVMTARHRDKNLAEIPILIRATVYNYVRAGDGRLLSLLMQSVKNSCHILATLFVLIPAAVRKHLLGNCCRYCSEHTNNDTRICDQCQIRFQTERAGAEARENEARDLRDGSLNNGERELTSGEIEFDPYQILRVKRDANKDEIKTAYFYLIKQYHPDRVSHLGQEFQKLAQDKAQLINRAYQILIAS